METGPIASRLENPDTYGASEPAGGLTRSSVRIEDSAERRERLLAASPGLVGCCFRHRMSSPLCPKC